MTFSAYVDDEVVYVFEHEHLADAWVQAANELDWKRGTLHENYYIDDDVKERIKAKIDAHLVQEAVG